MQQNIIERNILKYKFLLNRGLGLKLVLALQYCCFKFGNAIVYFFNDDLKQLYNIDYLCIGKTLDYIYVVLLDQVLE